MILLNPWQYENLSWEFQTPWFFINTLVLFSSLILSYNINEISKKRIWLYTISFLAIPWIALASTGQGLAVAIAFIACSWLRNKKVGGLVSISTALACISFYVILPYSKPDHHPEISFQLEYLLRALFGGPWKGLALMCTVTVLFLLLKRQAIPKPLVPSLVMPGIFSVLFSIMITLSRAGFGVEQADSSRYVTHSAMLGLSVLMALALVESHNENKFFPMLGGFLVLITTIGSLPQALIGGGPTYDEAWERSKKRAENNRQGMVCHSRRSKLQNINMQNKEDCNWIFPDEGLIDSYFRGNLPVQPLGWHKQLSQTINNSN